MNERTELFRDQAGSIVEAYGYLSGNTSAGDTGEDTGKPDMPGDAAESFRKIF